jgi:hypothetical protein
MFARAKAPYPPGLTIDPGGRYLRKAGQPFLIRGDTPWELIKRPPVEVAQYLDDIVGRGFNTVILEFPISPAFAPTNYAGNPAFNSNLGGGSVDFSTPNTQWFSNCVSVLKACAARNVVALVFPCYVGFTGTSEGFRQAIADNDAASGSALGNYGAYFGGLVAPYPNVVIMLGGDYLDGDSTTLGLVKKISDGIKTTDRAGRVYSYHAAPNVQTYEVDSLTAGWRASVNSAFAGWEYAYEAGFGNEFASTNAAHCYTDDPAAPKPFFLGESHYIGSSAANGDSKLLRRQPWGAMLGGACGTFIGNDTQYGGGPFYQFQTGWQSGLGVTAIQHEAVMGSFFAARSWWLLVPSTGAAFVSAGGGTSNTAGYKPRAQASDGSWGAVHVTDGTSTTIDFSGFNGTKTVKWFDPTNGSISTVGTHANSGTQAYTPSGNNAAGDSDMVLVLE